MANKNSKTVRPVNGQMGEQLQSAITATATPSNPGGLLIPGGVTFDKPQAKSALELEIERLKAENEALKARPAARVMTSSMRVSEKGALSIYGLGRFPVTLYREQWERLLAMVDDIRQFIADNDATLKVKGQ